MNKWLCLMVGMILSTSSVGAQEQPKPLPFTVSFRRHVLEEYRALAYRNSMVEMMLNYMITKEQILDINSRVPKDLNDLYNKNVNDEFNELDLIITALGGNRLTDAELVAIEKDAEITTDTIIKESAQ